MEAPPGSVVIVLTSLVWRLVLPGVGFFPEIAVTPSRASHAPTGFVACTHPANDINPVGAKLARDAFNA